MRIFVASMALVVVASSAVADLKSEINSMNEKVTKAFMKKDFDAADKCIRSSITKDFKYIEEGHTMTYDQMFSTLKMSLGSLPKIDKAVATTSNIKSKGNSGSATSHHTIIATMIGPDKKPHKMVMTGSSDETYVKQGKSWKMSVMKWKDSKMTLDGKPFDPSKMGAPQPTGVKKAGGK